MDHNLDHNLDCDHNPEDVPVYTGHKLFHTTNRITFSALARKTKGQGNFVNLRAPSARECCGRAAGIRSFLKTRLEMVASEVIFIDILEN